MKQMEKQKTTFQNFIESLDMIQEDIAEKMQISQAQVSYDKKNKTGAEPIIKYAIGLKKEGTIEVEGFDFGKKVKLTIKI